MASIDSFQFRSLCNLQLLIGKAKLRIPSSFVVFRRRHKNLNWVQLETNRKFLCKSIGDDSLTPDEEIQNTQNDDEVDVATTQSDIAHDSENSVLRLRIQLHREGLKGFCLKLLVHIQKIRYWFWEEMVVGSHICKEVLIQGFSVSLVLAGLEDLLCMIHRSMM